QTSAKEQCAACQVHQYCNGARPQDGRVLTMLQHVSHYPTVTSAIAIPTLATDRPPTIEASQTNSRTSLRTDFHIGLLSPLLVRRTAGCCLVPVLSGPGLREKGPAGAIETGDANLTNAAWLRSRWVAVTSGTDGAQAPSFGGCGGGELGRRGDELARE